MSNDKNTADLPDLVIKVIPDKEEKPNNKVEDFLKITGLFLTATTLFFTCQTYQAAQKWQVAEFTSQKFKEFSENSAVRLTNEMLDYNTRAVALFEKDSLLPISDDLIYAALVVDTINGDFSMTETKVRDIFDEYFDQLSLFNRYAKANLIQYSEIKPYLIYQASIICDKHNTRKTNDFRFRIWDYLNYYGYTDVKELYENFGYDITDKTTQDNNDG